MSTLVAYLQDLIKKDNLEEALRELENWADGHDAELHTTVILQTSRLNQLRRNERMGLLSRDEAMRTRNQIRYSVLSLLDELPEQASSPYKTASVTPPSTPAPMPDTGKKIRRKLFISYAREDHQLVTGLKRHLHALTRSGHIESWSDSDLMGGQEWNQEIEKQVREADIILYMISIDFIHSEFITKNERVWAEDAKSSHGALIIPVLLRHCYWKEEDFARYGALPKYQNGELRPVSEWEDKDRAYVTIVEELKRCIDRG